MPSKLLCRDVHCLLLSGLLASVAVADAAGGYKVDPAEEAMVHVGMTADQVTQALGHPSYIFRHGYASGQTWSYDVARGGMTRTALFDVSFAADGHVAWVDERTR
jgi:outer membrane protein assembly factor BamE (lipoprotein component of BamABCDE complex)